MISKLYLLLSKHGFQLGNASEQTIYCANSTIFSFKFLQPYKMHKITTQMPKNVQNRLIFHQNTGFPWLCQPLAMVIAYRQRPCVNNKAGLEKTGKRVHSHHKPYPCPVRTAMLPCSVHLPDRDTGKCRSKAQKVSRRATRLPGGSSGDSD